MKITFEEEVKQGDRFQFGENWKRFLSVLNDERIAEAEKSLQEMLEVENLQGKSFLDIGSGSGLFSLAARRLGAKVHSFDYDPQSVACTQELKGRYFPEDSNWTIEQGSVLNIDYIKSLRQFDIVYSWGVLHHTGAMWQALDNASLPVVDGGQLCLAIYNDQGSASRRWLKVKQFYCSGIVGRTLVSMLFISYFILMGLAIDLVKLRNPILRYKEYKKSRGMSIIYDWYDWLGGYPYEVAKPEEIFKFYQDRGFMLKNLLTTLGSLGNNQFVFVKQ
ncbi:methyltransferase [Microcoleus sp. FACHB-SPT15]|uniref:class I SAM-dependent methyltransferase n=1 Tax=Microcoleus sp. FACHB-SPT15 TaxID=2692830 RepID=UPI00178006BD|nr:class I SAM-dependent methyltransferase [Microcoleus sp. FACHB-SPT15]MBD1806554.1 methyltransferase [Microcoleus sp. FACHB-SPT15]